MRYINLTFIQNFEPRTVFSELEPELKHAFCCYLNLKPIFWCLKLNPLKLLLVLYEPEPAFLFLSEPETEPPIFCYLNQNPYPKSFKKLQLNNEPILFFAGLKPRFYLNFLIDFQQINYTPSGNFIKTLQFHWNIFYFFNFLFVCRFP